MKQIKMDNVHEKHTQLIENLLGKQLSKQELLNFSDYKKLFTFYNSHTNLISKNDENVFFEKHIYDSLCLSLFFNRYKISQDIKLLDIGTGGGFPSIPLSIVYPEMKIYPVDSIAKKIGFIELVQKELRLKNLFPKCMRVEDLNADFKNSFDVVTSRAVASLNTLLEYSIPFVKIGGYFAAYKSKTAKEELEKAANAMDILKCEFVESISYNLPLEEDFTRELLIFKKNAGTSHMYPRKSGQAKKNPL